MPNPSIGNFTVTFPSGISTGAIKIYNMLGEKIRAVQVAASVNISLEGEAPGIYMVRLFTDNGIYSQRVVIAE